MADGKKSRVTLVTLTLRKPHLIERCIKSVQEKCKGVEWNWFIRENTPGEFLEETSFLASISDQRIKVFRMQNIGNFSSMNNELVSLIEEPTEYLLFLNNDTEALTDFISEMVKLIEAPGKNIGITGACLMYPPQRFENNKARIQHAGVAFNNNRLAYNINYRNVENGEIPGKVFCMADRYFQAVTGACMLIRTDDFKTLGGFDNQFNWCYDDVDLCLKMRKVLKKKCAVAMKAGLIHHESVSLKEFGINNPNQKNAHARLLDLHYDNIFNDSDFYQADYARVFK